MKIDKANNKEILNLAGSAKLPHMKKMLHQIEGVLLGYKDKREIIFCPHAQEEDNGRIAFYGLLYYWHNDSHEPIEALVIFPNIKESFL